MLINIAKVTAICVKFNITYQEFCFLYLVHTRDVRSIVKYTTIDAFNDDFRATLEDKGLLLDLNKLSDKDDRGYRIVDVKNLHTTPLFDNEIKKHDKTLEIESAFDELLEVYPYEFKMDDGTGRMVPYNARTGRYELNKLKYDQAIAGNLELHKEIIELTRYAKEHNLIKKGLEGYIDGRMWGGIKEQRDTGFGVQSSDLE